MSMAQQAASTAIAYPARSLTITTFARARPEIWVAAAPS